MKVTLLFAVLTGALLTGSLFVIPSHSQTWRNLNLPGGHASRFAADSAGNFYVGLMPGGVAKSTDGGRTWFRTAAKSYYFDDIAVGPDGTVYAVTYASERGFFRSTDGGGSWTDTLGNLGASANINVGSDGTLYLCTFDDVRVSQDGGKTWSISYPLGVGQYHRILDAELDREERLLVATYRGIYRSGDKGKTWDLLGDSGSVKEVSAIEISNDGTLISGTNTGLYVSHDDGALWQRSWSDSSASPVIYASPTGPVFAQSGMVVRISYDIGSSWTDSFELRSPCIDVLWSEDDDYLVATLTGIYRVKNLTGDRNLAIQDLFAAHVEALAVTADGTLLAGGTRGTVSSYDGTGWKTTHLPANGDVFAIQIVNRDIIIAGLAQGRYENGIFRTTDGGSTWTRSSSYPSYVYVYALAMDSTGVLYAGSIGSGVWFSEDLGETWRQTSLTEGDVWSLAAMPDGRIIAGLAHGVIRYTDDIRSTWQTVSGFVPPSDVQCLHVSRDGRLYAGYWSDGCWRSSDSGKTWMRIYQEASTVNGIVTDPSGRIHLGISGGYVVSSDDGASWSKINDGLDWRFCMELVLSGSKLYYASFRTGPYVLDLPTDAPRILEGEENAGLSITMIDEAHFQIRGAQDSPVRVWVCDVLGRTLSMWDDGHLNQGTHTIAIPPVETGSGVLFITVEMNGERAFKKLTVRTGN